MANSFNVPVGTCVFCNRCDHAFYTTKPMTRKSFAGQTITRLEQFELCPVCGMMDMHWVYASDMYPFGILQDITSWLKEN